MRKKLIRPWTEKDIDELRRLAAGGWSVGRIGARLKRGVRVVKLRAQMNAIEIAGVRARRRASRFEQPSASP